MEYTDARARAIQYEGEKEGRVYALVYVGDQIARIADVLENRPTVTNGDSGGALAQLAKSAERLFKSFE